MTCPWCGRTDKHNRRSCRMTALNRQMNADPEHQRMASLAVHHRGGSGSRPKTAKIAKTYVRPPVCRWCGSEDTEHDRLRCFYDKRRREAKGYLKRGSRHEHRIVAEEMLGRPLRPGEVVHHIDENKQNNDPSNLHVFASRQEHLKHHAQTPYERTAEHRARMSARIKEAKRG